MSKPEELSKQELITVVKGIIDALYLEDSKYNLDKQWSPDTVEDISAILSHHNLIPE